MTDHQCSCLNRAQWLLSQEDDDRLKGKLFVPPSGGVRDPSQRMLFDIRTIAFRQTLDWASTNARLGLDKRSFVPRLPIVCEQSNARLVFSLQSRGISLPIEGILRCFLGGVAMLSRGSPDALYGIPSMVIRDPFDGYTGPLRCLYETPSMGIRFQLMEIRILLNGNRGGPRQIFDCSYGTISLICSYKSNMFQR